MAYFSFVSPTPLALPASASNCHSRIVRSALALARHLPSGLNATPVDLGCVQFEGDEVAAIGGVPNFHSPILI